MAVLWQYFGKNLGTVMKGYLRTFSARLRALPKKKAHDDFGNDPLPLGGNSCREDIHTNRQQLYIRQMAAQAAQLSADF